MLRVKSRLSFNISVGYLVEEKQLEMFFNKEFSISCPQIMNFMAVCEEAPTVTWV